MQQWKRLAKVPVLPCFWNIRESSFFHLFFYILWGFGFLTLTRELSELFHGLEFWPPSLAYSVLSFPTVSLHSRYPASFLLKSWSRFLNTFFPKFRLSSVAQSCPTLCDPMNCSTPGLAVCHKLPESTQTHVHWVNDAIQPSHPPLSPSPALNLSQHQGLFQWVSSLHQVARVL